MTARQILNLAGMSDADTLNAPAYLNRIRFGAYYSDLVMPLAKQYGFHPLFLFSVIRQESLFDGFVRSSAGANGLMQIIPATGEGIAADLGWPENYTQEDLNRPLVNLTFGVDYLDHQRAAFDGDLYAALAAYNGGPGNAQQWRLLAPDDPDLFLEVIRFAETRNYIRGIFELFNIYRLLYDRTP
jgi:soluble lytic murein transglycosylase